MRLRERVDVIVQAGLRGEAAGTMVWDVSDWDDPAATWGGLEPEFAEIDGWSVERVDVRRGRDSARRRHPAGSATVVLVWRETVDQPAAAGRWSFRPTSPIQLGQELRVMVRPRSIAGVPLTADPLPIFRGSVRSIEDGWYAAKRGQMLFRLTALLSDRFADLAAVDLPERPVEGLGDLTQARVARILEMAGISTFYLRGDAGVVEHSSSNFARNLLDEAQVTAESETGDFYVDREGYFVTRERYAIDPVSLPARESAALLVWSNLESETESIGPTGFGTGQALDDVVNQVSMARSGGTAYIAGGPSTDSALRYGLRTYQRFDLTCRYDADVEYAADYWLALLEHRTQRIEALEARIDPNMADDRLLELLDIEIGDRHDIRWSDGAATLEGALYVQGIAHSISGSEWAVTVNLWARYGAGLTPEPARWSIGRWNVDVWAEG